MNRTIYAISTTLIIWIGLSDTVCAGTEINLPTNVQVSQNDLLEIPLQFSSADPISGLNVKIAIAVGTVRLLPATPASVHGSYRLYIHDV